MGADTSAGADAAASAEPGGGGAGGATGSGGAGGAGGPAANEPVVGEAVADPGHEGASPDGDAQATPGTSRRFPTVTQDTARPEGGGRAAPGDAPAPARQWPLLSVVGAIGLGLLIVGLAPFEQSFRIGTILVGVALITGAILRRILPSVGMLAVRSRFTDMVTYGLLGVAIVLLSLMTQPRPWLEIPFLEDVVHSTVP
ncbi:DUF3017 domain-containing protein [Streptomyces sp. NBC_01506]|uniref:DUF3017 domain-containing protein n=1 Tax=Streptomyces sp. NBC_01506 TaxID=2903887 RepID=UPI0038687AA7